MDECQLRVVHVLLNKGYIFILSKNSVRPLGALEGRMTLNFQNFKQLIPTKKYFFNVIFSFRSVATLDTNFIFASKYHFRFVSLVGYTLFLSI